MNEFNKNFPLVTVVSPCYNHEKFIIESLESIKNQTYKNIEHIIIDDCSTDNSVEVIKNWIKTNNYDCTFIAHNKNMGISSSLNESITISSGAYWSPLATDDVNVPHKINDFVTFLLNNERDDMVVSDCTCIDEHSAISFIEKSSSFFDRILQNMKDYYIKNFGTYESLILRNYIPSSIMIKKSIFEKIGLFNTNLAMEDWDMWLRLSRVSTIRLIDEPLTFYRVHGNNSLKNVYKMEYSAAITILAQYDYCKKNNLLSLYNKRYIEGLFFSPLRHPKLTWQIIKTGPVHLYFLALTKKVFKKVFR